MRGFGRFAANRAALIIVALLGVALLAGGSWALTGEGTETPDVTETGGPAEAPSSTEAGEASDASVERYHGEDCTLATGLEGNWSHGNYVSAVAKDDDDATTTSDAAKSRCGKPLNAGKDGEKKNDDPDADDAQDAKDHGKPESPGKSGDHRPGDDSADGS